MDTMQYKTLNQKAILWHEDEVYMSLQNKKWWYIKSCTGFQGT